MIDLSIGADEPLKANQRQPETMNVRRAVGSVLGGAGLVAAANATISARLGPLDSPLERAPSSYRWRGLDVSYTTAGDPANPDLIALHDMGLGASSREFVGMIDELTTDFHVIAPDYPGFGRSERAPLFYSGSLYEDFLAEFVSNVAEAPVCLAVGMSVGYAAVATPAANVRRIVGICPHTGPPSRPAAVRSLLRNRFIGQPLLRALALRPGGLPSGMDRPYAKRCAMQPGARFAQTAYLIGDLCPSNTFSGPLPVPQTPVSLLWGQFARNPSLATGQELAERTDSKLTVIDRTGLRPHIERPEAVTDFLLQELGRRRV